MKTLITASLALTLVFAFSTASKGEEAVKPEPKVGFRIDFSETTLNSKGIPNGWEYKGKPGTSSPKFEIVKDEESGVKVLKMSALKASGTILFDVRNIDFEKYPVMRWKWKIGKFPTGADGRESKKDDQALGIYMGNGRLSQTSVAYRWETVTPKGESGTAKYGGGLVKVNWSALRNESDGLNKWYIDQANVRDDLVKAMNIKEFPKKNSALSLSINSQYTGTESESYLEYIEFISAD